ncbi:4'-phosphopantetheinyl transferase superfamily protein [Tenacibaculum aiptasiae]|uniref:4'-phosphopantetheinyl transferase superfamily protein n=1 Tax=Tenacibaculum aiptasiae TaxID=426481 RepID=A0A7J5ANY2_9FLAO|nr:4'-phosphopantetheinyl transferase superfamily protein [Tenacibaculum aiptasiae]KAB1158709.1 4'-phosphopantetheinyl transferase superfamily protein [Tenacibaculum aiptasiae]
MTVLYYTKCKQLSSHSYERAVSSLPLEMQNKVRKYMRWQDAHAYLYGKLLLKKAVSDLGHDYNLELIQKSKYGKPYFENSNFGFNISHSGEYIVCIISTEEKNNLGIDIEEVNPIEFDSFKNVFSEKEKREISNYKSFYTFWTRKEAVVKADGRGLLMPLNTINTTISPLLLDNKAYYLYEVEIDQNYVVHVATSKSLKKKIDYSYIHSEKLCE